MYRLMVPKSKMEDFIMLVIFDKMFDPESMNEYHKFNEFFELMESRGLKSEVFKKYFDIDTNLRSRYKNFKRDFTNMDSNVMVYLFEDREEENSEEGGE